MTLWYTSDTPEAVDRLVSAWPDAPTTDLETLGMLLEVARDQVWDFAPESHTDDDEFAPVPVPTAASDRPSFTVPIAQAGIVGSAIVSSPFDRVMVIDITITNTTAAAIPSPQFLLTNDPVWALDAVEVHIDGPVQFVIAAAAPPNVVSAQVSGDFPAGAEWAARLVAGLVTDPGPVPTAPNRLVYAQLQQAKNLWNAGRVNSNGETGMDQFSFTPRPLDKNIRLIIRHTQGVPSVG